MLLSCKLMMLSRSCFYRYRYHCEHHRHSRVPLPLNPKFLESCKISGSSRVELWRQLVPWREAARIFEPIPIAMQQEEMRQCSGYSRDREIEHLGVLAA